MKTSMKAKCAVAMVLLGFGSAAFTSERLRAERHLSSFAEINAWVITDMETGCEYLYVKHGSGGVAITPMYKRERRGSLPRHQPVKCGTPE